MTICQKLIPDPAAMTSGIPLFQAPVYAAAARRMGLQTQSHALRSGGVVVGSVLVTSRRMPLIGEVRAALRGPVWYTPLSLSRKAEVLRDLGGALPRLFEAERPDDPLRQAGYRQLMTAATIVEMPLRESEAAWQAALAPKWRTSLRQGRERALGPVTLGPFEGAAADWLLTAEAAMRRARRYHTALPRLARAIAATSPGALSLCSLSGPVGPLAAMLFARHGRAATYLLGATSEEGRQIRAHHVLLAGAARQLRDDGVVSIDLGTIDTQQAPGLARFKLGTGGVVRKLGGSWLKLPVLPSILPPGLDQGGQGR